MKIAFLSAGVMGSGFVRRLLARGHKVHVWNRSPASAKALEVHGAKAFVDSADAVAGVEPVHLSLADDASVDAVLEQLVDVIPASCWIIDHTTTTPSATGERARRWAGRGRVLPARCRRWWPNTMRRSLAARQRWIRPPHFGMW